MFDSEYDDLMLAPSPTQFPKTDINFYMLANNTSALQPWSKTTINKFIPLERTQPWNKTTIKKFIPLERTANLNIIRRRNLSNQSYQRGIKYNKKKINTSDKHQIAPSTLTFFLTANNSQDKKLTKKTNVFLTSRKNFHPQQQFKTAPYLGSFMVENFKNRGLPTSLRHTNLLKMKQEHQNKVKQLLTKKQFNNKNTKIKLNRFQRSMQYQKQIFQSVSANNIILSQQPLALNTHDIIKKPRKASFVGIRKLLSYISAQKYI